MTQHQMTFLFMSLSASQCLKTFGTELELNKFAFLFATDCIAFKLTKCRLLSGTCAPTEIKKQFDNSGFV